MLILTNATGTYTSNEIVPVAITGGGTPLPAEQAQGVLVLVNATGTYTVDVTAPIITSFQIPVSSASYTIPITAFVATDGIGVTGYLITQSTTVPSLSDPLWSANPQTTLSVGSDGAYTFYAWAKDNAGNLSASVGQTCNVALADVIAPVITAFTLPAASTSATVSVTLQATDAVGVTAYALSLTNSSTGVTWQTTVPTLYIFSGIATAVPTVKTLYAFAKDAAGNISTSATASTTITIPDTIAPVVTGFTLPASGTSATITGISITATDNVAVTQVAITETNSSAGATWASSITSFVTTLTGNVTLYAWAKDAAGNISASRSATTIVAIPDAVVPVVTSFTLPATIQNTLLMPVTTFTATDNIAVTGYLISESATPPVASDPRWASAAPTSFQSSGYGTKTFYAFAKDFAGNISTAATDEVSLTASYSGIFDIGVVGTLTADRAETPFASGEMSIQVIDLSGNALTGEISDPTTNFDGVNPSALGVYFRPIGSLSASATLLTPAAVTVGSQCNANNSLTIVDVSTTGTLVSWSDWSGSHSFSTVSGLSASTVPEYVPAVELGGIFDFITINSVDGSLLSGDTITAAVQISLTVSGTMSVPNQINAQAGLSVVASGVLSTNRVLTGIASVGIIAGGVINSPSAFTGTVGIGLTASGAMAARIAMTGTVSIPLTASGTISVPVTITGTVGISLAVSGTISPYQAIADAVAGAVTAWVVNTATGGHSTYSNFTFNSFFRLGNDYYGCSDSGFVKLSGTTDAGTAIHWSAKTGITTFGKHSRKYVPDARVTMRADGDVALREIIDEETDISNALMPDDDRNGIHARRVKLPKGVRGTSWQFELSGTGTLADIKSLEVEPIFSQRT